jgi:hypothetical protein
MKPNPRYFSAIVVVAAVLTLATNLQAAEWKEKVLYSFQGGTDGWLPQGGVVFDSVGNLYGTTSRSGSEGCPLSGCGTVFEISPPAQKGGTWTETTLYTFQGMSGGATDGAVPVGGVIIDEQGNLYGTTAYGGNGPCKLSGSTTGCGIVYELTPPAKRGGQWTYTILYNFQGGDDGQFPWGDLVFDKQGNLYGATQFGGGKGTTCDPFYQYCGTVFRLGPPKHSGRQWTEKVLHSFAGGPDGANPNGGLVLNGTGEIYGTTVTGGNQECKYTDYGVGCGTVFELMPSNKKSQLWHEKQVHVFSGGDDGAQPNVGLTFDATGRLYGVAGGGSSAGGGIVFRLVPSNKGLWKESVMHWFSNSSDGAPAGGVSLDAVGNLYGTTVGGDGAPAGTVFRLSPPERNGGSWILGTLHTFKGSPDGNAPEAALVIAKDGHLYGTTTQGGSGQACQEGCGAVFAVFP